MRSRLGLLMAIVLFGLLVASCPFGKHHLQPYDIIKSPTPVISGR